MTSSQVIEKIKKKGYWYINIHPADHVEKLISSRTEIKQLVYESMIQLRGWYYPHFGHEDGVPYFIENGVESFTDWENHVEFWRMTQSLNFVHLFALPEDYLNSVQYSNIMSRGDELIGKKLLGVLGTLYTLCEIFEFAKRMSLQNKNSGNFEIKIELHDTLDRILFVDSYNRVPFLSEKRSHVPLWSCSESYEQSQLIENIEEIILTHFVDLVELFGWENPPMNVYMDDIKKFLAGKI